MECIQMDAKDEKVKLKLYTPESFLRLGEERYGK
jgi:hypothetical protein